MKRILFPVLGTIGMLVLQPFDVTAEVTVRTEQVNPADSGWVFKQIPGPSKSDVAQGATVVMVGNDWERTGAKGSVLVDGRLPESPYDLSREAFLSNRNADNGRVVVDLGHVQRVAAVASYSWHEYDIDQGARGPQVYTLYASANEAPDPTRLEQWEQIVRIDTRPNGTGAKWNGQYGVFIQDGDGVLGAFRYLLFALERTRSPLQRNPNVTGTLFAEIDVHTEATLNKAGDAGVESHASEAARRTNR